MEDWLYVMFIDKGKDYKKINKAMVIKHVEYIIVAPIDKDVTL